MHYLMILLSLVFAGTAQAQTCYKNITADTPVSRFVLNSNGTAFDKKTGLTWMRCALGQTWNGMDKTCDGSPEIYNWQQALNAAEATGFAGFGDWRLPNYKELSSIVEGRCYKPAINLTVFPAVTAPFFWSATPHAKFSDNAWAVYFVGGGFSYSDKYFSNFAVRLVRGGR